MEVSLTDSVVRRGKAGERMANWKRLETTPMTAIAALRDGSFLHRGKFAGLSNLGT